MAKPVDPMGRLVYSLAFSPEGRVLATAGAGGVRLWDPAKGTPVGYLLRHRRSAYSVTFSPDGRRIVTTGLDGRVRLWDPRTSEQVGRELPYRQHAFWAGLARRGTCWRPSGTTVSGSGTRFPGGCEPRRRPEGPPPPPPWRSAGRPPRCHCWLRRHRPALGPEQRRPGRRTPAGPPGCGARDGLQPPRAPAGDDRRRPHSAARDWDMADACEAASAYVAAASSSPTCLKAGAGVPVRRLTWGSGRARTRALAVVAVVGLAAGGDEGTQRQPTAGWEWRGALLVIRAT